MPKELELSLEDEEALCELASALSSPARIQTLKLLYYQSCSINEIAERLNIPYSSAALYVKSLEKTGLISTEIMEGSRGSKKLCSRNHDLIRIRLNKPDESVDKVSSISMPVGCYTDCRIVAGCGIVSGEGYLAPDDRPEMFYIPEHTKAQLIWTKTGYVEYRFPNLLSEQDLPTGISLSFEVCSEFYNYNEDWKSDITVWINGIDCGTWRCPSDYGKRRGLLNPEWWSNGCTQYGKLMTVEVNSQCSTINSTDRFPVRLQDLRLKAGEPITVRIGNKPDAEFPGGFNLFGTKFGDYAQDIILSIVYRS